MKVAPTALVVKANRLIEASYQLSLVEQRIMEMAIAWSRIHVPDLAPDTWVELSVVNYAELYGIDESNAYKQLKDAARSLKQRTLTIASIHEKTGCPATIETSWLTSIMYVPAAGIIQIRFSDEVVPCISRLERQFTSFNLRSIIRFSSAYAIRLYELLKQYESIGQRYFELAELRNYLEANDAAYDRIDNLKSRVVDKAVEQITLHSDLHIQYVAKKLGRNIVGINFLITKHQSTIKKTARRKTQNKEIPIVLKPYQQIIEDAVQAAQHQSKRSS